MTSIFRSYRASAWACLLSCAGVFLVSMLCRHADAYRFFWAILCVPFFLGSRRFFLQGAVKGRLLALSVSFIYLLLQSYGYQITLYDVGTIESMLICLGLSLCLAPAPAYLIVRFFHLEPPVLSGKSQSFSWRIWLRRTVILLLAWSPVFLAFFPGMFDHDADVQLAQYLNGTIDAWHPPLHTLWLGLCYSLGDFIGSYNIAFAIHTLSQMGMMAAIFAYALCYLDEIACPRIICNALMLIFAVSPVHSVLVISCTKDILFTGLYLVIALEYHRFFRHPDFRPITILKFLVLALFACLMRNNACYGLLAFCPLSVLLARRGLRLRVAALTLSCFALSFFAYQTIQNQVGNKVVEIRETMSIPIQQLARTCLLVPEDEHPYREEILEYLPRPDEYLYYRSDDLKWQRPELVAQRLPEFLDLWLRVVQEYPVISMDAFLKQTQGYWWMDDESHARSYGSGYDTNIGYLFMRQFEGFQIGHVGFLPPLKHLFRLLFNDNLYQKIPILSLLFAPAFYLWLALLVACRALVKKQIPILIVCLLMLCYQATLFLGPCVLIRYNYPLMVITTIALIMTFIPSACKDTAADVPA